MLRADIPSGSLPYAPAPFDLLLNRFHNFQLISQSFRRVSVPWGVPVDMYWIRGAIKKLRRVIFLLLLGDGLQRFSLSVSSFIVLLPRFLSLFRVTILLSISSRSTFFVESLRGSIPLWVVGTGMCFGDTSDLAEVSYNCTFKVTSLISMELC